MDVIHEESEIGDDGIVETNRLFVVPKSLFAVRSGQHRRTDDMMVVTLNREHCPAAEYVGPSLQVSFTTRPKQVGQVLCDRSQACPIDPYVAANSAPRVVSGVRLDLPTLAMNRGQEALGLLSKELVDEAR